MDGEHARARAGRRFDGAVAGTGPGAVGKRALTDRLPRRPVVQRFAGEEHKQMGDHATGGERLREFADLGIELSFGDAVMLSGDVFGYLEAEQPRGPGQPRRTSVDYLRDRLRHGGAAGRDEVRWAIWFARADSRRGPEPPVAEEIKARVRGRYLPLAKDNVDHFSHGGTARETYLALHTRACDQAWRSTLHGQPAWFEQAKTDEAFAQHYLSDMFAGGHVRTPRAPLEREERGRDMPSVENIISALAWSIYAELHAMGDFGLKRHILLVPQLIKDEIVARIKAQGGDDLQQGSYAALVAKALHDRDNRGLEVVSARGAFGPTPRDGHRWRAVGDGHVLDARGAVRPEGAETYRMAVLAMAVSRAELDAAAAAGRTAVDAGFTLESIGGGQALGYVPAEATGMNPDLATDSPDWDLAVDQVVRAEVLPRLLQFYPDVASPQGPVEATLQASGMTLHLGAAMKRVAQRIDADPSGWIRDAMLISIPSVRGDGPPPVAGPTEAPVDAGTRP